MMNGEGYKRLPATTVDAMFWYDGGQGMQECPVGWWVVAHEYGVEAWSDKHVQAELREMGVGGD